MSGAQLAVGQGLVAVAAGASGLACGGGQAAPAAAFPRITARPSRGRS